VKKADPRKSYQSPKRKLGATTHFSAIIELKIHWKEIAMHSLYFHASLELLLLN